jgi:hypothetical protein
MRERKADLQPDPRRAGRGTGKGLLERLMT